MDKKLLIQLKTALRESNEIWDGVNELEIRSKAPGLFRGSKLKQVFRESYEGLLHLSGQFRKLKSLVHKLPADPEAITDIYSIMLGTFPSMMVLFNNAPKDFRIELAKDFLAYQRTRSEKRVQVLASLLTEPGLAEELDVSISLLGEKIDAEVKTQTYLQSIRAGEQKIAKLYFIYPLLTILRLNREQKRQRIKFMHELLVSSEAPNFGMSYFESEIGPEEEMERIRKWDDEAIEWYKKL